MIITAEKKVTKTVKVDFCVEEPDYLYLLTLGKDGLIKTVITTDDTLIHNTYPDWTIIHATSFEESSSIDGDMVMQDYTCHERVPCTEIDMVKEVTPENCAACCC